MEAHTKTVVLTDWSLIVATLHHAGVARGLLNGTALTQVWTEGDGYGRMTAAQLKEFGLVCDWSHIRDSSDEAQIRVAAKIRELLPPGGLLAVARAVARNGGDTVDRRS